MKNTFLILGFVLCSILGFLLMQVPDMINKNKGPWAFNGIHMSNVQTNSQSMVDKCRLDRLQGRLKGHLESVLCANPSIRAAFLKEGFPRMDKVDAYLAARVEYAKKFDKGEITEDELKNLYGDALDALLASAR